MIRRNERWDLPKGHREMGEEFDLCAAREAEEETGVKVTSVGRLLATTLHSYNFYGKWELKLTAWYHMRGEASLLVPQQEEGIICAEWIAHITGKPSTLNSDKYNIMKQRNWLCDTTPIEKELGFTIDYSLERGTEETIQWYKQEKWL